MLQASKKIDWIQLGVMVLLLGGSSLMFGHGAKAAGCQESDRSISKSPDGRLIATVYENVCELGLVASAAAEVKVALATAPSAQKIVIAMDAPSNDADWPRVRWESTQKLVVVLPNYSKPSLQLKGAYGVSIDIQFCPNDPIGHARWLAYKEARERWIRETAQWYDQKKKNPGYTKVKPPEPVRPSATTNNSERPCDSG